MAKKRKEKNRRAFLLLLALLILVFDSGLGWLKYSSHQQLAAQITTQNAKITELDSQIATIKASKAKAAAQTASANAALADQLAGKVVTPNGCAIDDHSAHQVPSSIDLVVNKKHCYNPIDYAPSDLTTFDGFQMSAKIVPSLSAMFSAASAAGYPLSITSGYRSYNDQVNTYNGWLGINGTIASTDGVSARPGYSEHQSGFAVDLTAGNCSLECFLNTPQFTWLSDHAADYGFIQRYPVGLTSITGYDNEAWHYRYVGTTVAEDMKKKGIKTLEQYWNIPGGDY